MAGDGNSFGSYLPEFQGYQQAQQAEYSNKMNQAADALTKSAARSNLQSGGSYLTAKANMGAQKARGLQQIAGDIQYKRALLARDEHLANQRRQWQVEDINKQRDWQNQDREAANKQALWSAVGGIGAAFLNPVIGGFGTKLGNFAQYGKSTSPYDDYLSRSMSGDSSGRSSYSGGSSPLGVDYSSLKLDPMKWGEY